MHTCCFYPTYVWDKEGSGKFTVVGLLEAYLGSIIHEGTSSYLMLRYGARTPPPSYVEICCYLASQYISNEHLWQFDYLQAEEGEKQAKAENDIEKSVLEEFGRCLVQIIDLAGKSKKSQS